MNDMIWIGNIGFSAIMLFVIIWNLILTIYIIKLNKKHKTIIKNLLIINKILIRIKKKKKSVVLNNDCGL